jgi:hypothetical protein
MQAALALSLLVSIFLLLAGIYLSVEGFSNTLYWRSSHQPWVFQAGRILRGLIGVSMIVAGLMK